MGIESIKPLLFIEHSKKNTLKIVGLIVNKKEKLSDVFKIITQKEPLYAQRAAWIISILSDKNIGLLEPYISKMIFCLNQKHHNSVYRAIFKALSKLEIPEKFKGQLFDIGIQFLIKKSTATGIKTWIIDLLMNISIKNYELQKEINSVLQCQINESKIGIVGKMTKTIQKIDLNSQT